MAAVSTPQSVLELARSLSQDDIPAKLRCANCNLLVLNAFRLPCCDQNICEECQSTLPTTCSVCQHTPISADDCKPNKSLRLTVRAFLKSEERKREKEKAPAPPTPIVDNAPTTTITPVEQPSTVVETTRMDGESLVGTNGVSASEKDAVKSGELKESEIVPNKPTESSIAKDNDGSDDNESNVSIEIITEGDGREQPVDGQASNDDEVQNANMGWNNQAMGPMFGGYGFNGNQNGFSGMDWSQSGAFNPMMQIQMQPNTMNGNWGIQNLMGGMNPMDMTQGMFGGYGMQGMEMNGNMMGMDFNSGYSGWNNSQQMSSDYGSGNFYAGGGGYNQSHHGQYFQHHPKNNYQNRFHGQNSFPNRRESGQFNAVQANNQGAVVLEEKQPLTETPSNHMGDSSEEVAQSHHSAEKDAEQKPSDNGVDRNIDDSSGNRPKAISNDDANATIVTDAQDDSATNNSNPYSQSISQNTMQNGQYDHNYPSNQMDGDYNQNMYNNYPIDQSYQMGGYDYSYGHGRGRGRGRYGFRGGFRGRGGYQQQDHFQVVTPAQPTGVGVEGAPTGPKAMREGLPNVGYRGRGGFYGPRGGGHQYSNSSNLDQQSTSKTDKQSVSATPKEQELESKTASRQESERPRSRSRSLSKSRPTSRSRSRSRSKSRDGHRHRSKKHRSQSASSERYDYEREKRSRKYKTAKQKYDDEESSKEVKDGRGDKSKDYSRDQSVESDRSKYRSSKREKEKDRYRSSKSRRESSRERRRNRHRSRSPKREDSDADMDLNGDREDNTTKKYRSEKYRERNRDRKDYDHDKDRGREKHRERDRDKKRSRRDQRSASVESDSHHRSSRHNRRDRDRDIDADSHDMDNMKEDQPQQQQQQSSYDKELKIQGRSRPDSTINATIAAAASTQSQQQQQQQAPSNRPAPPTGPKAPPTGPRALLDKLARAAKATALIPTGPSHSSSSTAFPPVGSSSHRSHLRAQSATKGSSSVTVRDSSQITSGTAAAPSSTAANGTTINSPTVTASAAAAGAADPHTLEREARNKERLLKEQQRRQQLEEPRKRSFAEALGGGVAGSDGSVPTEPRGERERKRKGRRVMNYKYEDEENDEARANRVEKEREASRWN